MLTSKSVVSDVLSLVLMIGLLVFMSLFTFIWPTEDGVGSTMAPVFWGEEDKHTFTKYSNEAIYHGESQRVILTSREGQSWATSLKGARPSDQCLCRPDGQGKAE